MNPKDDYSLIISVTLKPMIDRSIIKIEEEIITSNQENGSPNCINFKIQKVLEFYNG